MEFIVFMLLLLHMQSSGPIALESHDNLTIAELTNKAYSVLDENSGIRLSNGHTIGEKMFSPGFHRIYCWSGYSSCCLRIQLYVYLLYKSIQRV